MKKISLNDSWLFRKLPDYRVEDAPDIPADGIPAQTVALPHTWYSDEEQYKGLCVYEKTIPVPAGERLFISFDAADQSCRVYVNGVFCGAHRGGYARFRLPIPEAALADTLSIQVFVENPVNEDICPSFGDFTVFGGLYRGAELLVCGKNHFDRCFFGTDGLIVRASLDKDGNGCLALEPHAVCASGARVRYTVRDAAGADIAFGEGLADETVSLQVEKPHLWNGRHRAYLYTVTAELLSDGVTADTVELRTGFRTVELTGDRGLLLNGRTYPIRGVAKHQDFAGVFCAVGEEQIRRDFELIDEIGATGVRLSHYQHPQKAYDCCDELGLLAWAEVPMLKMTESAALMENTEQQLRELILQNIHHPAIFCWGIQNEIAMFKDAPYMHENCRKLHAIVRELDPNRASAAANLYPLKASSKLNEITDIIGYNVYFGWYYGEMHDYGAYLDKMHRARPTLPFGVTEYGVDTNITLHSSDPHVKDYSEEYQALWCATVYEQIETRPWLWGSFVWNMFDFHSARRNEGGQRFINAKGLVTNDRETRKDAFYYYKARWSDEPVVHICGKRYAERAKETTAVRVFTNQPAVTLSINGESFSSTVSNATALFENVPLLPGENCLTVSAGDLSDSCVLTRVETEPDSYRLPDSGGGAVRNWFLAEDSYKKEGFFSLEDTANDLLDNPRTREIIRNALPELYKVMTEKNVIPLGLTLKSILSRDADGLDLKAINAQLNEVPNED
ncbi:MAG: beta-galactosidase [Oscillospiraceae bacterium]|nr:beta-galactosidase [Oscillospiraceae bacterium]